MSPREFLNTIFDVAVQKAHPKVCLPPFLDKNKFCGSKRILSPHVSIKASMFDKKLYI